MTVWQRLNPNPTQIFGVDKFRSNAATRVERLLTGITYVSGASTHAPSEGNTEWWQAFTVKHRCVITAASSYGTDGELLDSNGIVLATYTPQANANNQGVPYDTLLSASPLSQKVVAVWGDFYWLHYSDPHGGDSAHPHLYSYSVWDSDGEISSAGSYGPNFQSLTSLGYHLEIGIFGYSTGIAPPDGGGGGIQ